MARAASEALEPLAANVTVVEASTVVCVRQAPPGRPSRTLVASDYPLDDDGAGQLGEFSWPFTSGLQVLMGQSEVINWVRSSPDELATMRCTPHHHTHTPPPHSPTSRCMTCITPHPLPPADAGEWKFPGGSVDAGETLEQAAARELAEEFELSLPASALLRPFTVKYTRAIQGRSYTMFNFMAAADENPWLAELDLDEVNARLAAKREHFAGLLESGEFWELDKEGREAVSPEVHSVQWLDIADAVEVCLTSKNTSLTPVNEWQERAYAEHGITAR